MQLVASVDNRTELVDDDDSDASNVAAVQRRAIDVVINIIIDDDHRGRHDDRDADDQHGDLGTG